MTLSLSEIRSALAARHASEMALLDQAEALAKSLAIPLLESGLLTQRATEPAIKTAQSPILIPVLPLISPAVKGVHRGDTMANLVRAILPTIPDRFRSAYLIMAIEKAQGRPLTEAERDSVLSTLKEMAARGEIGQQGRGAAVWYSVKPTAELAPAPALPAKESEPATPLTPAPAEIPPPAPPAPKLKPIAPTLPAPPLLGAKRKAQIEEHVILALKAMPPRFQSSNLIVHMEKRLSTTLMDGERVRVAGLLIELAKRGEIHRCEEGGTVWYQRRLSTTQKEAVHGK